jgi:hypothetical protein
MDFAGLLEELARETIKASQKSYKTRTRVKRGATLRPGPSTPLWNELAKRIGQELPHYGDKAKLARILSLPRQRVHQLMMESSATPDAERTLLLLVWLQARLAGRDLG